jgi:hypothetical protein
MAEFKLHLADIEKVLDILERLGSGIASVKDFPASQRTKMRSALSEAAQLLDTILSLVRQRLHDIILDIDNDPDAAKLSLQQLANVEEWEQSFRQMSLCGPLRATANDVCKTVVGAVTKRIVFKDATSMEGMIQWFMRGESQTAESVGTMLQDLATLHTIVAKSPKKVVRQLNLARETLQKHRSRFIALEADIQSHI